jgi:putative SOS response-associated peptidase YedK
MCGSYGFSVKNAKDVYERFDTYNDLPDYKPRWNIKPGQESPIITRHSPDQISRMVWGLIPFWAKDDKFKLVPSMPGLRALRAKPPIESPSGPNAA